MAPLKVSLPGRRVFVDRPVLVGRGSDVELRVEDDRVSRKHLRLVPGREGWLVEDLNSSNGTFFRGQRIHTLQVEGPTRLVLADARSGVPIELEPSPGLDRHPAVPPPQAAPEGRKATALRVRTTHGEFTIVGADTITIGRDIQNTLRLEDPHVSRFHATLRQDDEGWKLLDIGSSNGTYHNGQRIEQVTVTDATSVRFGDARHGPQVWLEPATAPGGTAAQASPGRDGVAAACESLAGPAGHSRYSRGSRARIRRMCTHIRQT